MKKLMIIGAGDYQIPLIETAIKRCLVVLVAPSVPEKIKDLVYKVYISDVTKQEQILEFAKQENIDGVITDQTDIAVRTVAYVAEKMDLPGIGYEVACLFTDKSLMRQKQKELGIKVLPNYEVNNLDDAINFYNSLGCKCIVKPTDCQGSRGVTLVENLEELKIAFDEAMNFSRSKRVIIEKFATGSEFVVEGIAYNYEYNTLICGDTNYFDIQNMFAAKNRLFPSIKSESLIERILLLNEQIITGFGLKQGISHSEFIMDGEDIYLIETAARGGGVFISSDLINLCSGLETEEFLISIALGELNEMPLIDNYKKAAGYMCFLLPKGKITSIQGLKEIQNYPFVHRNLLYNLEVGKTVSYNLDKTSRYSIIVSGNSYEEMILNMETVKKELHIEVTDGDMKKGPIWD